jgi:hypothetical protein
VAQVNGICSFFKIDWRYAELEARMIFIKGGCCFLK